MRPLEDVLTFDLTPSLTEDVIVVGEVMAHILFSSDLPTADLLVKLCDVDAWGVSRNVAEGYVRVLLPDDSPTPVRVVMATAYKFSKGHRIRALLCS
ncbi:galactose-binding domain-like protein, partial [Baffinella frigidus]